MKQTNKRYLVFNNCTNNWLKRKILQAAHFGCSSNRLETGKTGDLSSGYQSIDIICAFVCINWLQITECLNVKQQQIT